MLGENDPFCVLYSHCVLFMLQAAPRDATKISVSVNKQGIFSNMALGKVQVVLG